jgi:putative transposase
VNMSLRKLTKNRGSFPSDEALTKLFYLALRNISQKWTMPIRDEIAQFFAGLPIGFE